MTAPRGSRRALVRHTHRGVPYTVPPSPRNLAAEPPPQPRSGHDGPPEPTPLVPCEPAAPAKRPNYRWQPKLTEDDVREIRAHYAAGRWGVNDLADIYGVTQPTMSAVVHRRTWRHVTDQPTEGN